MSCVLYRQKKDPQYVLMGALGYSVRELSSVDVILKPSDVIGGRRVDSWPLGVHPIPDAQARKFLEKLDAKEQANAE